MRAKTYRSTNNWTSPQSLSTFGVPIRLKRDIKHLGLEEFNFCDKLNDFNFQNKRLAYVPCFSKCERPNISQLDLFFSAGNNVTLHYATLHGVQQISDHQIKEIRNSLNQIGYINWIEHSQDFQNNYEGLFGPAFQVYIQNFHADNVIAQGHDQRFVFNVLYDKIEFITPMAIVPWANLKRARHLYL
jgi:hypothetical protein